MINFENWMNDFKVGVETQLKGKFNEAVATETNSIQDTAQLKVSSANQKTQLALEAANFEREKSKKIMIAAVAVVILIFILKG